MVRRLIVFVLAIVIALAHLQGAWAAACSPEQPEVSEAHEFHAHGAVDDIGPNIVDDFAPEPHHCDGVGCPGCAATIAVPTHLTNESTPAFEAGPRDSVAATVVLAPWRPPIG